MPTPKIPRKTPTKTVSRRDNFSNAVIQILYKRAGGKCCRCFAPTFGPVANNPSKSVNIGQAAHITAAAPGGPRYDPKMSPEERASTGNGMWMCSNCHDIIDRDVDEYPTTYLKETRKIAEKRAKAAMGVGTREEIDASDGVCVGVSAATIIDIRKAKAELRAVNGDTISETKADELLESMSYIDPVVDRYLVDVARELTAFYEQLIVHCKRPPIVLEVVRRLKILADTFHSQWSREDVEAMCRVSGRVLGAAGKKSRVYQSGTALLKDISKYPSLKDKDLHTIPIQSLRDLRGRDSTDGDGDCVDGDESPPQLKRACLDAAGGPPPIREHSYIELMEQLSRCEDSQTEEIEERLIEMGYEPEVF